MPKPQRVVIRGRAKKVTADIEAHIEAQLDRVCRILEGDGPGSYLEEIRRLEYRNGLMDAQNTELSTRVRLASGAMRRWRMAAISFIVSLGAAGGLIFSLWSK